MIYAGTMRVPARLGLVKSSLLLALPLLWITYEMLHLGPSANPAKDLNHLFGRAGFYMLALNLIIGSWLAFWPLPNNLRWLFPFRRPLGVAGTLYTATHIALHFVIEGDLSDGISAIVEARYLWFGLAGFLILLALALTSNNASVRKLGKRWKKLHRLAYLAFGITSAHALSIEKADLVHFSSIALLVMLPLSARLLRYAAKHLTSARR